MNEAKRYINHELDKALRRAFENECKKQGKHIHFAALSITRGAWSDIYSDLRRNKYSLAKAVELYDLAVKHKIVTLEFAELEKQKLIDRQ